MAENAREITVKPHSERGNIEISSESVRHADQATSVSSAVSLADRSRVPTLFLPKPHQRNRSDQKRGLGPPLPTSLPFTEKPDQTVTYRQRGGSELRDGY